MALGTLQGTAQHLPLASGCVHAVVTSPPYFGLRQYAGVEPEAWPVGSYSPLPGIPPVEVPAWYGCYGNEPTVLLYVWHTLCWLREASRVLRDDGVCWVVIGDSYAGSWGNYSGQHRGHGTQRPSPVGGRTPTAWKGRELERPAVTMLGLQAGSLLGIPWQVALAAQADGWILRNDCIWAKDAPMPASVKGHRWEQGKCQCVHREHHYSVTAPPYNGYESHGDDIRNRAYGQPDPACPTCQGTGRLDTRTLQRGSWRHTRSHEVVLMLVKHMGYFADSEAVKEQAIHAGDDRNPRTVFRPAPMPYSGAHYAAYPPALIVPLIRATVPAQCCATCGTGYAPVVTHEPPPNYGRGTSAWSRRSAVGSPQRDGLGPAGNGLGVQRTLCHGIAPTCTCASPVPPTPGLLLDPFGGSGTTALVGRALRRQVILVEASSTYLRLQRQRLGLTALAAWAGQQVPAVPTSYVDLPLFGG